MSRPIRHADLVARALGQVSDEERARIDRALEDDAALRQAFETVAGHLLQYDQLPPPPPPPPFARIEAALDRDDHPAPDLGVLRLQTARPQASRQRVAALAAAAAVLLALLVWRPWSPTARDGEFALIAGRGMQLLRSGEALPAPAGAQLAVRSGDLLRCAQAAEARLGTRVRLVLDGGGSLRIEDAEAVTLVAGRAWFEVAPGPFEVRTEHGPVRVLGTAFEVDVRSGELEVAVARGRVAHGAHRIGSGERLAAGRVATDRRQAGAWFARPVLRLQTARDGPHRLGAPMAFVLGFRNPGQVPLVVPGPAAARTALWISFETRTGEVVRELPVREAHVVAGRELLRPGSALELGPDDRRTLTFEILPPVGSPGAYRCRALYRPAGQPGVLSTPLDIEVR